MGFSSVTLQPGVDTDSTPTLSQAAYNTSNLIRWKGGLAEKLGGWIRFYSTSIGSVVRDLHAWEGLSNDTHLGVGAVASLSVITSGVNNVITPQVTITNGPLNFSTTTSSPTVTIVDTNISNPTTNNSVFFDTPVSVDGLLLSGLYSIDSILSATSYTITATSNASATVANGGSVPLFTTVTSSPSVTVGLNNHGKSAGDTTTFLVSTTGGGVTIYGAYLVQSASTASYVINVPELATSSTSFSMNNGSAELTYYIAAGPQATTAGYGTGTYGDGGYGTGVAGPSGAGTPITAIDWTSDNWGEIYLACPQLTTTTPYGPIYQWSPDGGFANASIITQAPIACGGIFVAMPQQILVAWGASFDGFADPLQIYWSDSQDYTNWTATSSTFAGGFHIPTGSRIVGGIQAPQQGLIWTDIDVWSMTYINLPLVFGFNKLMTGCGLIGSHAMCILGNTVYWMSQNQFFYIPAGGGPRVLPCKVWDFIFQDLDTANAYKIRMGSNSAFNEWWCHFPSLSGGTGENDSYVKFNPVENAWDYGNLPTGRTAWIDQSVLGTPIGADPTGLIFQHEQGYNGDGAALNPLFRTGYWVIAEGEEFAFVDQILPDMKWGTQAAAQTATVLITLYFVNTPNGDITVKGPYSTTEALNYVTTRGRGRQMAIQIESQDLSSFWRIGKTRYRYASDGRR